MNWTEEQRAERDRRVLVNSGRTEPEKPSKQSRARGVVRKPAMNKTETRYSAHLAMRERLGEIAWHRFEGITLKLADDTRFTADFAVMTADGSLELHDTKALWRKSDKPHIEDDALVKMRVAAQAFPFRVIAVWPLPSGEWGEREF